MRARGQLLPRLIDGSMPEHAEHDEAQSTCEHIALTTHIRSKNVQQISDGIKQIAAFSTLRQHTHRKGTAHFLNLHHITCNSIAFRNKKLYT